jgi:hypothetical protein
MKILFKYQKQILLLAAIFNLGGAIVTLISPSFFFSQFFKNPPDLATTFPYLAMYHYVFFSVVFIFGIAYWMTALDPVKNKIILFVGSFGKLVAVAFWIMLYLQGHGKWGMLASIVEDGLMGIIMGLLYFSKAPVEVEPVELRVKNN